MAGPQYKRRLIPIVNRRFQFKYTAIIVGLAAVVSTVLGYFLLQSYMEMNEVIDLASLSPEVNDKLNSDDAFKVFLITIIFLFVEVIGLGVMGLLITHRVCGPIFVLHKHLSTMLEGKYPNPRPLRAGDEFGETFEAFRAVIDGLKKRDADEIETLKAAIAAAKAKGVGDGDVAVLQKLIDERAARTS